MSYIHLANTLYDLRADKLRDMAMKKYNFLDDDKRTLVPGSSAVPAVEELKLLKLNVLLDRAQNFQGDLSAMYDQGVEFGLPPLKFSELVVSDRKAPAPEALTNLQKALNKNLKRKVETVPAQVRPTAPVETMATAPVETMASAPVETMAPKPKKPRAPKKPKTTEVVEVVVSEEETIETEKPEPVDKPKSKPVVKASSEPLEKIIDRLKKACEGKAYNEGGYNVPQLLELLRHPPVGEPLPVPKPITKPALLEVICGKLVPQVEKETECVTVCKKV